MRALMTITAILMAGAALTSCDMPAGNKQQAVIAPCNCTPPAAVAAAPAPVERLTRLSYAPRHHYHRHFYRDGAVRYNGDAERVAERSVDSYDYVSASRVSVREQSYSSESSSDGYESYGESSYGQGDGQSGYGEGGYGAGGRIVWVDGYGRGYFAGRPPTVSATMRGERLTDPYHGYLTDCPENGWH